MPQIDHVRIQINTEYEQFSDFRLPRVNQHQKLAPQLVAGKENEQSQQTRVQMLNHFRMAVRNKNIATLWHLFG